MSNLNNVFNTDYPVEVISKDGEVTIPNNEIDKNVDYDYEKTRNNLHTLLEQGKEALFYALEVAKQSEHPRAFEVVGGLMKQLSDINHQLLDLSEKRQKMSKPSLSSDNKVTNNTAVFVGSTDELNKMIQKMSGDK